MPPSTFGEGVIMCFPGEILSFSLHCEIVRDFFNELPEFSVLHPSCTLKNRLTPKYLL